MAESIVKVPSTASNDFDFLAFSFNGKHSYDDFKLYRTIDGDRYNVDLSPQMNDKTAENTGGDGMYFFNTNHKQKVFNISFAFEEMSETQLRQMKRWLDGKTLGDLWFEEEPYKVYTAKVTGTPTIKYIPFETNVNTRVYRGEGSVQFTAYWPYAHTPDKVEASGGTKTNGKIFSSYSGFRNKNQWAAASGLTSTTGSCTGENPGDLPAPFVFSKSSTTAKNSVIKVGDLKITLNDIVYKLKWDSKTGIVSGTDSTGDENKRAPVPFSGNSLGGIPVGNSITWGVQGGTSPNYTYSTTDCTLNYHYWYY